MVMCSQNTNNKRNFEHKLAVNLLVKYVEINQMRPLHAMTTVKRQESLPLERASALDFKDSAAPRFGHSDVVFFVYVSDRRQTLPPVSHQKNCLKRVIK